MSLSRIVVPFLEVKSEGETGEFTGLGSTFGNVDLGNDIVMKGAFGKSLDEHKKNGTLPAMFWQHDHTDPVGDWTSITEGAKGLIHNGVIWKDKGIPRATQAYMFVKGTAAKGLSIGYTPDRYEIDSKTGVRRLHEVGLKETSIVSFPMNPKAIITGVKSADGMVDVAQLEDVLAKAGLSTHEIKNLLSGGLDALRKGIGTRPKSELFDAIQRTIHTIKGEN